MMPLRDRFSSVAARSVSMHSEIGKSDTTFFVRWAEAAGRLLFEVFF
jgi:hypothetical protein